MIASRSNRKMRLPPMWKPKPNNQRTTSTATITQIKLVKKAPPLNGLSLLPTLDMIDITYHESPRRKASSGPRDCDGGRQLRHHADPKASGEKARSGSHALGRGARPTGAAQRRS